MKIFKQLRTAYFKKIPLIDAAYQIKKTLVLMTLLLSGLVFNVTAHAELLQASWNMLEFNFQTDATDNEDTYSNSHLDGSVLNDSALSDVSGMGIEAQRVEAEQKISVILWDERSNTSRRQAISLAQGQGNLQSVVMTITTK